MDFQGKNLDAPLLELSSSSGSASAIQTLGNIIVSIVGTGVLGLPYALRIAGWFTGSIGVIIAATATYYCMLLLVECREKLAAEEESTEVRTYGDLGYRCMGKTGRWVTEFLICISQCGGTVAYLVFIGQSLSASLKSLDLSFATYIFLLVPVEIGLSWIGSLSALAPFSIFADICSVLAMLMVVKEDIVQAVNGEFSFGDRKAIASNIGGLPFAAGMAVFCFEGFGMTLALEQSMRDRSRFKRLLGQALTGITLVYVLFAISGYMGYGDETKDIVTLNLPENWSTMAVQIGLCMALTFTFPIMVHPVNEIVEGNLLKLEWTQKFPFSDNDGSPSLRGKIAVYTIRAILVVGQAVVATCVPGFGNFVSLVGSTLCAMLSFVLPALFHLILLGSSMHFWQKALDVFILGCGLLFAAYGTYNSLVGV